MRDWLQRYARGGLAALIYTLDVHLIHAHPDQPIGKGKIERFFRTVRDQFLSAPEDADTRSLGRLAGRRVPPDAATPAGRAAPVAHGRPRLCARASRSAFVPASDTSSCRFRGLLRIRLRLGFVDPLTCLPLVSYRLARLTDWGLWLRPETLRLSGRTAVHIPGTLQLGHSVG